MQTFLKFTEGERIGLAFCAGYNQRMTQFITPMDLTGVEYWATVDGRLKANPTVEGDLSDLDFIRSLPQGIWDVVYLANCPFDLYSLQLNHIPGEGYLYELWKEWLVTVKKLLRSDGQLIIRGLGIEWYEGLYDMDDEDPNSNQAFQDRSAELKTELEFVYAGNREYDTPLWDMYQLSVKERVASNATFAISEDMDPLVIVPARPI